MTRFLDSLQRLKLDLTCGKQHVLNGQIETGDWTVLCMKDLWQSTDRLLRSLFFPSSHLNPNVNSVDEWSPCFPSRSFKSDLPDITGPDVFKVRPNSVVECELAIQPRQVGTVHGSVQFTAPTGQYCWFTVEITAGPPPCEGTVAVKSTVREIVEVTVATLSNLRTEPATFAVNLQGLGVTGEATVTVPANGSVDYKVTYRPLFPARQNGSVHFDSETLGLLWYKLELEAEPAPDEILPELLCEVGTTCLHRVTITNPLSKPTLLRATSSNPRNFVAKPATLTLPADGKAEVVIGYTPSVLGEVQEGIIEMGSSEAGTWAFRCSGKGSPPTSMAETTVTAPLKQAASTLVSFRNPFSVPVSVRVSIDQVYKDPAPFSVLLRRAQGLLVAPFTVLQIPVAFQPAHIAQLRANLRVELEPENLNQETLAWVFPIVGVAEYQEAGPVFRCVCKARGASEGVLETKLVGIGPLENPERFTYEVATEEGDAAAVAQALQIEALDEVMEQIILLPGGKLQNAKTVHIATALKKCKTRKPIILLSL
jgi:hypothetical protein